LDPLFVSQRLQEIFPEHEGNNKCENRQGEVWKASNKLLGGLHIE